MRRGCAGPSARRPRGRPAAPGERQPVPAHKKRALGVSERPLVHSVPVGVTVLRDSRSTAQEGRDRPRVLRRHGAANARKQQRGIHSWIVRGALPAARRMQAPCRGVRDDAIGQRQPIGGPLAEGPCALRALRPAAQIRRLCVHSAGSSSQIPASGSCQRSATVAAAISPGPPPRRRLFDLRAAAAKSSRASPNASSWN